MGYNIGPKIGIDGEAEFRKQIRDINSEYKALEAETRALAAAYEAQGDEQGKLEKQTSQLEKQIDAQKRKMKLLEDAVSKAADKFGENSIEATRLRGALYDTQATVAGLESELGDTNRKLNDLAEGLDEAGEEADDAGDSFLNFGDILNANLAADVIEEGLEELVDVVADFAEGSLDAAADVNAAGSQFEQTFGDMEDTARRTLECISDETDIAVTRMQGDFTKMYAFTKTAGADSEEAMDIAGRAMEAAADSAAYYDKSIEDVTETLQSFLKGNYENDAALGISATETTRNAKANEMYAMSFDKLSESQKIDVLLAMVEAGNAASGALGQAARESNSWANVQGELNEALTQMQATLGQPALEMAIPIIQNITAAIYELIETSEADKLAEDMDEVIASWKNAETQFDDTSAEIETSTAVAKAYADKLAELESAGLDTAESQREYANTVQLLNDIMPGLNLQIDEQTGLVNMNTEAIYAEIEALKQKALHAAYEEEYRAILNSQAQAQKVVADGEFRLGEIEGQRTGIINQLTASTGLEAAELIQLYNSQLAVNSAMLSGNDTASNIAAGYVMAGQSAQTLSSEEMALVATLLQLNQEENALNGTMAEANGTISEQDAALDRLLEILGIVPEEAANAAEGQDQMTDSINATTEAVQALQDEYDAAVISARESIDSQIGLFDQLATESEMSAQEIVDNWISQQAAFNNYTANMQKAVDMGLDQTLVQQLSDGSEQSMLILDELVNSTDTDVDAINEAFRGLSEAKDTTAEAMAEIRTGANAEMDRLIADANGWGIDIVNGAVAGIDANAYLFSNSMRAMATGGGKAFREAMVIRSPSRFMIDGSEEIVSGAVIGVDDNVKKFEEAMENLATAGQTAYMDERLTAAELYPSVMEIPGYSRTTSNSSTANYGGININIYQNEGESTDDLVDRVMDRMQTEIIRKEGSFNANG